MKVKAPPRMSSIQWFVSIAAGLAMFLLPQDAQSYFSDVYRQIFVAVVAFGIALVLLLLFKLYEPIGVAMLSSMFLTVITFAIRIGIRIYEGPSMEDFTMAVNVYDGVSWGMVWSMPLLCCFLMRIFAQGNWSEPEAKRDFCCFFQKASVASGCYLLILLLAIPLGLGAGAVDSGLNEYVAEHYESRHMSWLHCFWGVGAMAGPLIMSQYMSLGVDWRMGYLTVAIIQFVLVAVLIATLPLWDKVAEKTSQKKQEADANGENPGELEREADLDPPIASGKGGFLAPLKIKGAKVALISFFLYCGVEMTLGLWGSSFLITEKGIDAAAAAQWVSLYWGGLTAGRLVSGFLAIRFNNQQMIRIGELTVLLGVVCLLLPLPQFVCLIGFILVGAGCAPIYPCMLHETPVRFGKEDAQSMMGFQMAVCYTGSTLLPPFFGLVATKVNVGLLPVFLLVYIVIMLVSSEASNRIFNRGKQS